MRAPPPASCCRGTPSLGAPERDRPKAPPRPSSEQMRSGFDAHLQEGRPAQDAPGRAQRRCGRPRASRAGPHPMPERSARPPAPEGVAGGGAHDRHDRRPGRRRDPRRDGDERPERVRRARDGSWPIPTGARCGSGSTQQEYFLDATATNYNAMFSMLLACWLETADADHVRARAPRSRTSPPRLTRRTASSPSSRSDRSETMAISLNCLERSLEPFVPEGPLDLCRSRRSRTGSTTNGCSPRRQPRSAISAPTNSSSSRAGGRCRSTPGDCATWTTCSMPRARWGSRSARPSGASPRSSPTAPSTSSPDTSTSAACRPKVASSIFSDHHMGFDGSRHDFFRDSGNSELYAEALTAYADAGFTLVENGDVEELVIHEPAAPPPELADPDARRRAPDATRGGHRPPPGPVRADQRAVRRDRALRPDRRQPRPGSPGPDLPRAAPNRVPRARPGLRLPRHGALRRRAGRPDRPRPPLRHGIHAPLCPADRRDALRVPRLGLRGSRSRAGAGATATAWRSGPAAARRSTTRW